ncbi:hypothetical protein [Agromyces sp. NPDC049794]|uniref:hypothetical protein n=1 Tax=unclassified Agromyces TaxID=2639701 RepID=UPI0033D2BF92
MAFNRRSSAARGGRAVWAGVGLAVLAVVVSALSIVALTANRSVPEAGATPGATQPPAAVAEQVPSEPAAAAPQTVSAPTRAVAAIDVDTAVRTLASPCPEPSSIEFTSNAGATWEASATTVSSVQRITTGADSFVALIGLAAEGCAPTYERSFTGGAEWEPAPDELAASWFVDPANRAVVHAPAGDRAAPCATVVQLAVVDENSAALLCDDSSVHATVDAGASWLPPASVPGVAAIGVGADGYRVAVINQNGCVGGQLIGIGVAAAGLALGSAGGCLPATVGPGEAALSSADDGTTWLWAGDALARSQDGGATWL